MSEHESPSRRSADRIGDHVKRAFRSYMDHWQEWIVPMVIAAGIVVLSLTCCFVPSLLVIGPITCGLYCCASEALRDRPVDSSVLKRGWETAGSSIIASLFINIVMMLPVLVLYAGFFALIAVIAVLSPQPANSSQQNRGGAAAVPAVESRTAAAANASSPTLEGQAKRSPEGVPEQPEQPSPWAVLAMLLLMMVFYLGLFLMIILFWIWSLWFATRTMFVLPLIAHRRIGFVAALRTSWVETRVRFWELLAISFISSFISSLGMYAMYVGMIFTIPIGLTMISSVYEERFGDDAVVGETA